MSTFSFERYNGISNRGFNRLFQENKGRIWGKSSENTDKGTLSTKQILTLQGTILDSMIPSKVMVGTYMG